MLKFAIVCATVRANNKYFKINCNVPLKTELKFLFGYVSKLELGTHYMKQPLILLV